MFVFDLRSHNSNPFPSPLQRSLQHNATADGEIDLYARVQSSKQSHHAAAVIKYQRITICHLSIITISFVTIMKVKVIFTIVLIVHINNNVLCSVSVICLPYHTAITATKNILFGKKTSEWRLNLSISSVIYMGPSFYFLLSKSKPKKQFQ